MAMVYTQATDAQNLYDDRSSTYDNSWHPRFARHMVEMADPQPGESVLDLACGTGLVTVSTGQAVGPSGSVVGIDISSGMLTEARGKLDQHTLSNISYHHHSITDLDTLAVLQGKRGTFDLISCASALVLLPQPAEAVREWVTWLKPGGRLIVDVTHIQNQATGVVFERVGQILQRHVPYFRLNFQGPEDLRKVMEGAGLRGVDIRTVSQLDKGSSEKLEDYITDFENPRVAKEYNVDDADIVFDSLVGGKATEVLGKPDIKEQAKRTFREEWAKTADADGKVRDIDCVFVGIGWKP